MQLVIFTLSVVSELSRMCEDVRGILCRPVAQLLEVARISPLTVVPVNPLRRQPEAGTQLPALPCPAPLRSAPEPDLADAEQPPADADHPGTPDTHLSKVWHCLLLLYVHPDLIRGYILSTPLLYRQLVLVQYSIILSSAHCGSQKHRHALQPINDHGAAE